ncbi:hypothetical protein ABEB36_005077 [Hypothenemus hampei]|uniref:Cadherin domain-containing protein n=1 Tax=Hypothenemus hampei TaxID=57062 RepID=A0ABD1EX01_HYPHA
MLIKFLFVTIWQLVLVNSYTIEEGDSRFIQKFDIGAYENVYYLQYIENNHEEDGDEVLLFTVKNIENTANAKEWNFDKGQFKSETRVNNGEYSFYALQRIDYETENTHSYRVSGTFDGNVVSVDIYTQNIDDEQPTLTSAMCSMFENAKYDESNTSCTATLSDPDGWLGLTTFKIMNSNPSATSVLNREDELFEITFDRSINNFTYETVVYLITLDNQQLDYETKIFYSFVVQAKDSAGHGTAPNENVTYIVDVSDVNDMPPEWTDFFTTKQITEKTPYTFNVTAVDGDRGINWPITYSLTEIDKDICTTGLCVSIQRDDSGQGIITVEPIDRDAQDLSTYKFRIVAHEDDDPPFETPLDITFFIDDIDDNSPLFMYVDGENYTRVDFSEMDKKEMHFTFYENFAGTIDGKIFIRDIDTGQNAQFSVELLESDNPELQETDIAYTDAFLVIPNAGYRSGDFQISVRNATYLDFENEPWQNFSFNIHSFEPSDSTKEDVLLIVIHLLDYNDEIPKFELDSYTTAVNETIKKGQEIIIVLATDRDAEDFELTHRLVGADSIINLMEIKNDGVIRVAADNAFDYDRINPIFIQVQAIDKVNHTATVPVIIELLDINNKAPTFVVGDIIQVEENQIIGIKLNASIIASDVDTTRNLTAEINWDKSYARKNSQPLNLSNSNNLRAMQFLNLDFYICDDVGSIAIDLTVSDNNVNQTSPDYETFDTLYLIINITDLNTEVPEFLDKMSIEALVVVNIIDINDNPPIFTNDSILENRTVYELSKLDTIVGMIEAKDLDVGDTVTYWCNYTDKETDWFYCDSRGQLTVKSEAISADFPVRYTVSINCSATDGLHVTPQEFQIYILDTNNQIPELNINEENAKVVYVKEKSPNGTRVSGLYPLDDDRDNPFHSVKCLFNSIEDECAENFEIVDNEVWVSNGKQNLDRDTKKASFSCRPKCVDNPDFLQSSVQNEVEDTTFEIKLIDINDHCPDVQTPEFETTENLFKDETIGLIVALDLDEGDNSEIVMNIIQVIKHEGNEQIDYTNKNLFGVLKNDDDYYVPDNSSEKQWHLIAQSDLKGYYGEYSIQLNVSDLGTPPQSTEDPENIDYKYKALINITIQKFNYYAPEFIFPDPSKLTFTLSSDQEPEQQLVKYYKNEAFENIQIRTGPDDDNDCLDKWEPKFDVKLIDKSESFTNFFVVQPIDRCIGQLQVNDKYDKEYAKDKTLFQLRLTATLAEETADTENGESEYSQYIDLVLSFVDIDADPIFPSSGLWNVSLMEDNITQVEPLPDELTAYYPNVDNSESDDLQKYYFLSSTEEEILNTFEIDLNTGSLMLKEKLDYLQRIYYEFEITCGRNKSTASNKSASRLPVTVYVLDINNHVPQWTEKAFYGAILKNTQRGSTIVTVNATDLDEIDQGKLTYSINSSVETTGSSNLAQINNPFLLDSISGDISLNFQVEANMYGNFSFLVRVQDVEDGYNHGPFDNITSVIISIVTDQNLMAFKFENDLDSVVNKKAIILEIIGANLDLNCHTQDINKYTEDGIQYDNLTTANIYCMDSSNNLLLSSELTSRLNNINTFQQLRKELLDEGILLQPFSGDSTTVDNLQNRLKLSLIVVSVVLGVLCVILAISFVLKLRTMNKRLEKLTSQKFGSDESSINRKGISVPTANVFAIEGSNPVFNSNYNKDDALRADNVSVHSDNSELSGLEEDLAFDEMFGKDRY